MSDLTSCIIDQHYKEPKSP